MCVKDSQIGNHVHSGLLLWHRTLLAMDHSLVCLLTVDSDDSLTSMLSIYPLLALKVPIHLRMICQAYWEE